MTQQTFYIKTFKEEKVRCWVRNPITDRIEEGWVIKPTSLYVGVVSPYMSDYMIMGCEKKNNAIFHTERELPMVLSLLERNKYKYRIYDVQTDRMIYSSYTSLINNEL